ncbi:MAG: DUF3536 domain-containing protein [Alphaproteobacteria bacterium]|uniref:DUF3536 domain-containing protein n=1 Tax=Candidatus Nitrobium versatile TaxID=2884831 RepID=A0A953M1F6_9BACT|nr:DUF3536 domain-containing protein [Candidatus Nitrobium versatile]
MEQYICIHGHFYQPPRENPWLEEIEVQDSAYPYHDWNERISAECYAPNAASRLLDGEGKILEIVSNYASMSFNFGPTVLSWMEKNQPETYESIISSDKLSRERFSGHGSALAQAYNHLIMPLANSRDKLTQVVWGIRDFRKRFGRDPEGMWLPETAVDTETLEILAAQGILFTILAPRQAKAVRKIADNAEWQSVEGGQIDPTTVYLCRLPSGRTLHLFFYDGPISQGIAFEGMLSSGEAFAQRLAGAFTEGREWPQLVHIATDGETYGHHHRFGDMALAFCLHYLESNTIAKVTNYGEYLEKNRPAHEVQIFDNSSWSCIHGVERWRENCGCNSGMHQGWHQLWRRPLREALDALRDRLIPLYEQEAARFLKDPWAARDDYIEVILDRSRDTVEGFLKRHGQKKKLSQGEKERVLKLLELQRHSLLMYTSCGWFFDELSGIETVQVIQYAARAIQYAEELFELPLEEQFIADLQKTPSNVFTHGGEVYGKFVVPAKIDLTRVAAHYAISSLFEEYPESMNIYHFAVKSDIYEKAKAGKFTLAVGKARIQSGFTWDEQVKSFAVLHLGDHNINGGIRDFTGEEAFSVMHREIRAAFERGDATEIIQLMDNHFGVNNYSLWHLFRDEQRKVLLKILESSHEGTEASYRQIYELNSPVMNFLSSLGIPLPHSIVLASQHIINTDMKRLFGNGNIDTKKLERLIQETQRWSLSLDKAMIGYVASAWFSSSLDRIAQEPLQLSLLDHVSRILTVVAPLSLDLNLWRAQNTYFSLKRRIGGEMQEKAEAGDVSARTWLEAFRELGNHLNVKW